MSQTTQGAPRGHRSKTSSVVVNLRAMAEPDGSARSSVTAAAVLPARLQAPATAMRMADVSAYNDGPTWTWGVGVSQETVRLFVESWTNCWTLVLGLGYIGRVLYWPALASLCSETAARA